MLTSFIINFREVLEMLLIIVPMLIYVNKINQKNLEKYIFAGTAAGAMSSILVGWLIFEKIKGFEGISKQIFQGSIMIFISMLLLYNIIIIQKQNKYSDNNAENNNIDYKLTSANLFLVPFLTVFREGMEIVLFLLPLAYKSPFNIIVGALGGILISILIVLLIYRTTIKLSINLLFSLLTLFLIIIGAIMFGEGIMKLLSPETSSLKTAGAMVYGIPLTFLFLKRETKKYIKK